LALISVIASLNPQWGLWGLDLSGALPLPLRILILIALIVAILPPVSRKFGQALETSIAKMPDSSFKIYYSILVILAIGLFILFSTRNYLQGDGYNVMGHLIGGYVFSPTEPLDYLLHFALAKALGGGEQAVLRSYQICAYLAGAIFLGGIFLFLRKKQDIIIAVVIAMAFGVMQFFFGYVESYTFRFVLMFLYIISATRDLSERRISFVTVLLLVLAIGFHLSSLVLIPSIIYLIWNKYHTKRAMIYSLGLSGLALTLALADIFFLAPIRVLQIFVPIIANVNNPYHLLSNDHLFDIINGFLLSTPLMALLWLGISRSDKSSTWWKVILIAPAVIFAVLIDPKIGAFRDWDLLSITAAPIIAVLIITFIKNPRAAFAIMVPIILFSLLHTSGWISWNRYHDKAYQKIREIVHSDKHYSSEYYQGYGNKAWSIIIERFYKDYGEVVRAEEERFKGAPDDTLNACNLAYSYVNKGDSSGASDFVRNNWHRYLTDIGAVSSMGSLLFNLGYYHDTEQMYETYLAKVNQDYRLMQDLGAVKERLGEMDTAMALYDQSLILWKDAPIETAISLYLKEYEMKYYQMAQAGLERIYSNLPFDLRAPVDQLIRAINEHNYVRADSIVSIIRKNN
ncbi:MAG TPA: hypothetical protein DCZ43_04305, partial [candidate division Zixibacteria bacterium]|nr:hypothetical protein [candidate division Zixibacteria bacterium]